MFKHYATPLFTIILITAVLTSGCINFSTDNTAATNGVPDLPIEKPADTGPKVIGTTVDGKDYYGADGIGKFDLDGDGKYDFAESAVDQQKADQRHNGNMKLMIFSQFGIPTDSKLHQDYPNIEEFRVRQWDLDGDGKFK